MNEARFNSPLSADDPRLSEWLDGQLPEAEAAQIARLVTASAELTRLVADLRRQKAALAALPAAPPPAGFVQDVLASVDAELNTGDDDAAVEAEWLRIERERLEEEIAEARAGAAEPADEPMRHRWPWMVLVGALAAGLLTAIVINRPGGPGDREVALVEGQRADDARRERRNEKSAEQKPQAAGTDIWLDHADAQEAKKALATKAAPPALAARSAAAATAPQALRAAPGSQARTVIYRIRTAADRKRLEDLLAASGGEQLQAGKEKAAAGSGKTEFQSRAQTDGKANADLLAASSAPLGERIVISGPAARIAGLAAALEAAPGRARRGPVTAPSAVGSPAAPQDSPEKPGEQTGEETVAETGENLALLVIEIVAESGVAGGEGQP